MLFAYERPLCAKSGPSLTIIIYVRNIFGLATKEASHPSMMETSRATTSAVPTADIVAHPGNVLKPHVLFQKSAYRRRVTAYTIFLKPTVATRWIVRAA